MILLTGLHRRVKHLSCFESFISQLLVGSRLHRTFPALSRIMLNGHGKWQTLLTRALEVTMVTAIARWRKHIHLSHSYRLLFQVCAYLLFIPNLHMKLILRQCHQHYTQSVRNTHHHIISSLPWSTRASSLHIPPQELPWARVLDPWRYQYQEPHSHSP